MAGEKIILAELDLEVQGLLKSATDSKIKILELRAAQAELKKSGEEGSAQFVRNEVEIKRLSQTYNLQTAAVKAQIGETGKLVTQEQAVTEALAKENVTIEQVRANNSELLKLRNQLNLKTDEGRKSLELINAKLDNNTAFIKSNVSANEKQKMSIGGYSDAIKEAAGELNLFSGGMSNMGPVQKFAEIGFKSIRASVTEVKDALAEAKTAQTNYEAAQEIAVQATDAANKAQEQATQIGFRYAQGLATQAEAEAAVEAATVATTTATQAQTAATSAGAVATNAATVATKLFRVALISTGIGAIVVALGSLVAYLTSTQEGMDAVTKVTRPLQAIFSAIMGVAQKLGGVLVATFSNPKKVMNDLYEFVKQNLINRFAAFGEILEGIINLDFKKIGNGVAQGLTGVENISDKVADAAKNTGKFFSDAAKKGQEIDRLNKEIAKSQLALNNAMVGYNDQLEEQELISKDSSRSFAEREKAAREIIRINQKIGDQEAAIVQKRIEALKLEQSLSAITNEDKQEMIDLQVALDAAQDKGHDAEVSQMKIISGFRKEQRAEAEKAAADAAKRAEEALQAAAQYSKLTLDKFVADQGVRAKSLEDELALAEAVYKGKLNVAQKEYNASKKTENDKLALQIANANALNELNKASAENSVAYAEQELASVTRNNQAILDNSKFLSQQLYNDKLKALDDIMKAERSYQSTRLEEGIINQQQYDTEIARIEQASIEKKEALQNERKQAENERLLTDIENKKVAEEDNFLLQMELDRQRLEIQRNQELAEAEKSGASLQVIKDKYAQLDKNITKQVDDFKLQSRMAVLSGLKGLFGEESKIGKAIAVAEIINSTVSNAAKAFQQAALYASNPFTAALAPNAALQGGIIIATGAAQIAKTVGAKLERGGVVEIGGKRHSAGGTMFRGEDGTTFEAEQGELIGVMNRNAAHHFMAFNNAFPAGGTMSPNYFGNGGIVSREIAQREIDPDYLAMRISEANRLIPAPVVLVEDILAQGNSYVAVKSKANF
jgi:hypothetical protein